MLKSQTLIQIVGGFERQMILNRSFLLCDATGMPKIRVWSHQCARSAGYQHWNTVKGEEERLDPSQGAVEASAEFHNAKACSS